MMMRDSLIKAGSWTRMTGEPAVTKSIRSGRVMTTCIHEDVGDAAALSRTCMYVKPI